MSSTKSKTRALLVLLLVVAAAVVAGCGSSGSSSQSEGTEATATFPAKPFKGPAEITKFGKPGSQTDLQAASKVLDENLVAREKADFAKQCASLNAEAQTEITGTTKSAESASQCPSKLEALAKPLKQSAEFRKDTFDGSIDEIRLKGAKAFALFHGTDGKNYSIPLQQEAGGWKVGSIITTEIE